MFKYTILAIGAFLFIVLLCYIYNSKPRYSSIENKLFRVIVFLIIFCMIFEFPYYFTIHYRESMPITNEIICRFPWVFAILAESFMTAYFVCLGENYKVDKALDLFKVHWKFKLIFVAASIFLIVFMFLPFEYGIFNGVAYVSGPATYYAFILGILNLVILNIYIILNKKLQPERKRQIYFVSLISFITIPLQIAFPYIPLMTVGFCLDLYIIYFSLENPDLLLIAELENMKEILDVSNDAKSDFLSNMSHEIRSPMNAIIGFSESILNSQNFNEEEVKKDINNIRMAGSVLIDIINNVLDISKIESGKETVNPIQYKLQDIYYELISIIEARIGSKNINLIATIDEKLPSKLYGDKTKIYQILLNLLTNAVKYTEVGKIYFDIKGKINNDKVVLSFTVEDTGFGIKKEDFEKLFNKFVRLDAATKNDIEGTGLGLTITKKLVNLLEGRISFTSEYEVGTTFTVELEQKIIDSKPIGKLNESELSETKISYLDCSDYKVLLVDDNKLNLKVAERLLQPYGFKVTSVTNGKDAIYKVKSGEEYDLIFLDHMMPGMNGIEVLHSLKKLEYYDIPPIVALTANAITGMREMYLNEGFDEYLAKPINIDELNKLINKIFMNRK